MVPVVYRLNLRDANSYFLARAFQMRDKDILYVANAPLTEVQKFFNVIGTLASPVVLWCRHLQRLALGETWRFNL